MHQLHHLFAFLALFALSLHAAPPAMTPSTSTVTVSSAATIAFPDDRQILQTFTASTRAATAPIALGQCGLETDTGLLYVADGTSAGQWVFNASGWRDAIDLGGYLQLQAETTQRFFGWTHSDGTTVQLTSEENGGTPVNLNLNNLALVPTATLLATTNGVQTLTNKTISGSSNTLSNINLASAVTGTLPLANGGTGSTSLPTVTHYTPAAATLSGHLSGIDTALASATGIGGTTGGTDNALLCADGTGGATMKPSLASVNPTGTIISPENFVTTAGGLRARDCYLGYFQPYYLSITSDAATITMGAYNDVVLDRPAADTLYLFSWYGGGSKLRVGGDNATRSKYLQLTHDGTHAQITASSGKVFVTALALSSVAAPSSASDTGAAGEIRWDSGFLYVCTATNTWKRAAISTW